MRADLAFSTRPKAESASRGHETLGQSKSPHSSSSPEPEHRNADNLTRRPDAKYRSGEVPYSGFAKTRQIFGRMVDWNGIALKNQVVGFLQDLQRSCRAHPGLEFRPVCGELRFICFR